MEGDIRAWRCNVCRSEFTVKPPRPGIGCVWGLLPAGTTVRGVTDPGNIFVIAMALISQLSGMGYGASVFSARISGCIVGLSALGLFCLLFGVPLLFGFHLHFSNGRLVLIAPGPLVPGLAAGTLLVSTERIGTGVFARSLILLLHHSEEGSLGLIVNKVASSQARAAAGASPPPRVHIGGPVAPQEPTWVYTAEVPGSLPIINGVFAARHVEGHPVTAADRASATATAATAGQDAAPATNPETGRAAGSPAGTLPRLVCHRYDGIAGWGPAQLDAEVRAGAWVFLDATADHVFPPALAGRGSGEQGQAAEADNGPDTDAEDGEDDGEAEGDPAAGTRPLQGRRAGQVLHARLLAQARMGAGDG